MENQVATGTVTDTLAIPMSPFSEPWLQNFRRALGKIGHRPVLMLGFGMSQKEHQEVIRKHSILKRQITRSAGDRSLIAAELSKMLAAFPSQDTGASATLRVEAYFEALGDAPAWAVHQARRMIVRGGVDGLDQRFAPTPPQLAGIVDRVLATLRADMAVLVALEAIEPETSVEEREFVTSGFDDLRTELKAAETAARPGPKPPTFNEDEAALRARLVANGLDPAGLDKVPDQKEPRGFRRVGDAVRPSGGGQ